jgi:hypothetical protein
MNMNALACIKRDWVGIVFLLSSFRAICILACAAGMVFTAAAQTPEPLPYTATFQPPPFTTTGGVNPTDPSSLNGQQSWIVLNGSADITTALSFFGAGSQSAVLNPGSPSTLIGIPLAAPSPAPAVEYVDCMVKPAAGAFGSQLASLPLIYLDTSLIIFVGNGTQGQIYTYDGTNYVPTSAVFPVNSDNTSPNWMRLTFHLNFTAKTWDLYCDGVPVAQGLSFIDQSATSAPFFILQGHPTDPSYLNYLSVGYTNPISPLPDMPAANVPQPNPLPATPSGWDTFTPPVTSLSTLPSGSPTIAQWTRTGVSDDSLILTGDQLSSYTGSDQGQDTQFMVYGQTGASDAIQAPASIQRLDGMKAAITLPSGLPAWSTYFVWPMNSTGYGYPVAINRTDAWWLGPDQAGPGQTVNVYGRNLTHNNGTSINGGTAQSWVYIQQAGSPGQWATLVVPSSTDPDPVNPYQVQFTVPSSLTPGTYQVWVHNGHGGNYGWSGPLTLTVAVPFTWDSNGTFNPSSPSTFNVKNEYPDPNVSNSPLLPGATGDGTTDDTAAVSRALAAAIQYAYGDGYSSQNPRPTTLYFPTGTYLLSDGLGVYSGIRFKGDGMTSTFLECSLEFATQLESGHLGLIFGDGSSGIYNVDISDMTLDAAGNFNPATGAQTGDGDALLDGFWGSITHFGLSNVCINVGPGTNCAHLTAVNYASINNCTFNGGVLFLFQGYQDSVNNCNFYLSQTQLDAILPRGVSELSVTGCTAQDIDTSTPGEDNFIAANADYGTESNVYIADNKTILLGPALGEPIGGSAVISEGTHSWYQGTPAAATATTVTFSDLNTSGNGSNFIPAVATFTNNWVAVITGGTGLGQYRLISTYDELNTITVSPAWTVPPDQSSTVLIARGADKWVVYNNSFQGKGYYATENVGMAGIQPNAGGYEWIGDNNTITQMNTALIAEASELASGVETAAPCYFLYYTNNTIQNCYEGIRAGIGTAGIPQPYGIGFLGNVFRNNSVSNITTDGAYACTDAGATVPLDMTVFEHNAFTNLTNGINLDNNVPGTGHGVHSSAQNVILYKNNLSLGTAAPTGSFGVYFGPDTLSPALQGNSYQGFASNYAGTLPGVILEVPNRTFNLAGASGGIAQTATMTIWNSGTAPLNWLASSDSGWLTFSLSNGTQARHLQGSVADESSSTATLTCNPAGLPPGTYTGTITITSVAVSQSEILTVNFTVSP